MNIPTDRINDDQKLILPPQLPVLPAPFVAFPGMLTGMTVATERDMALVDHALAGDRLVILAYTPEPARASLREGELHPIGCAAAIVKMLHMPDGDVRLLLHCAQRVFLREFITSTPFFTAVVSELEEHVAGDAEEEAMSRQVLELLHQVVEMAPSLQGELYTTALNLSHPGRLADFIATSLRWTEQERLELLDLLDCKDRLRRVLELLTREREVLSLGHQIQSEAQSSMEKVQREYLLRQQLDAIRKELGDGDGNADLLDLEKALAEAVLPDYVREQAADQLVRLGRIPASSPEYSVTRDYLDWILALPWLAQSDDNLDLRHAQVILDEDHYDLKDVKERILELLAVRQLKPDARGTILCLVGPPGVGKTSLGQSIARAMGRQFTRMSLGGMHDEAELRGHRRTYIGALPGRIIQGLKRAGTRNPVFMLDELDKVGADYRGDPAAALLEALDPEQNNSFQDNYLELPFDLSQVFFITTANTLDTIPAPLLDRMEVLRLAGYTLEEKSFIAQRYLIPRQLEQTGLKASQCRLSVAALKKLIEGYTREAGVRNLERRIGSLCRKAAKRIALREADSVSVTAANLAELLGNPPFRTGEKAASLDAPGMAHGLAWTPVGGEVLTVEATLLPGRGGGELVLTGMLGEVMKESARIAFSLVRSRAAKLKLSPEAFDKSQVHIHVPAGAVPKDGPSAGVTMTSALASLFTGRRVRGDLAMTGEVTLSGQVLPIGGVKEKVLGALRAGLTHIVLPEANRDSLDELSEEVKNKLTFHFVSNFDELLRQVLEPLATGKARGAK